MNNNVAILCALLPLAGAAWATAPNPPTQNEWPALLHERVDGLKGDKEAWRLISVAEVIGKPDRKRAHLDPQVLDRYVSAYENVFNGKKLRSRVWREGTKLIAQTEGQEPEELIPASETVFFQAGTPEEGSADNIFVQDASGRAIAWVYKDAGIEFRANKVQ